MTLLQLKPLSPPVAISEMAIMLLGAAVVGYLIGRWITKGQLNELNQVLTTKEGELDDCRAKQKAPVAASSIKTVAPLANTAIVRDDLKKIEGIGPKIEKLLNTQKIYSFAELASTSADALSGILKEAGPRFQIHNPETWPEQASLARDGKWEELDDLQEKLSGGRDLT